MDELPVTVAVLSCPECGAEFEGAWLEPEPGEAPESSRQLCPGCGHSWEAGYPGFSFTSEA
jgi:uncharacterized protein (UPF0212 family)